MVNPRGAPARRQPPVLSPNAIRLLAYRLVAPQLADLPPTVDKRRYFRRGVAQTCAILEEQWGAPDVQ